MGQVATRAVCPVYPMLTAKALSTLAGAPQTSKISMSRLGKCRHDAYELRRSCDQNPSKSQESWMFDLCAVLHPALKIKAYTICSFFIFLLAGRPQRCRTSKPCPPEASYEEFHPRLEGFGRLKILRKPST